MQNSVGYSFELLCVCFIYVLTWEVVCEQIANCILVANRTVLTVKSKIEMFKILKSFMIEQVLKDCSAAWC